MFRAFVDAIVSGLRKLIAAILDLIEGVGAFIGEVVGSTMQSYNKIETADSEHTLVAADSSMVSGFRLEGLIKAAGPEEFVQSVNQFTRLLSGYVQHSGYTVQVVFERDPNAATRMLSQRTDGCRQTVKRMGMEIEDVLDAGVGHLSKFVAQEKVFIALWTRPGVLTASEGDAARKRRREELKGMPRINGAAQDIFRAIGELRQKHEGFVANVAADLKTAGFIATKLTAHEMLRETRMAVDPGFTPDGWSPSLPGDPIPRINRAGKRKLDWDDVQYPPIAWQLFPREPERLGTKYVQVGDRLIAPQYISLPPRELTPFSSLVDRVVADDVPFRIAFLMDGGGIAYVGMKRQFSTFLSWTNPMNKNIRASIERMQEVAQTGAPMVQLRISAATWAPAGQLDLLRSRSSMLAQSVMAWGQAEVREISGDPVAGLLSTVPFATTDSIGQPAVAPLRQAAILLPVMRPASPWVDGSMMFRTADGKVMPFLPGSKLQTSWNYIIFAKPGMGKSNLLNSMMTAVAMSPGIARLPRIAMLDIGPSSQGFIELVRDGLPEGSKHYALHRRIRNTTEYAINPFDLDLGARQPTPSHRAFLVNILTLLVTPPELAQAYESMSQLVNNVIELLYRRFSGEPRSTPKPYGPGKCLEADALIRRYGMEVARSTTWFDVVDFLFDKGHAHEASLAQRFASPLLVDAIEVSRSPEIVDLYQNTRVNGHEPLVEAFQRLLSDAIRSYPVLGSPTVFDLGEARVCAVDIDEVAKEGSASALRQTQLMYMLARYVLTKDFRFTSEDAKQMPERYIGYHDERVRQTREDMKWVVYDEFHRASKSRAVIEEVVRDMREGRKWNMGVVLSSQEIDDFPREVRSLIAAAFILNGGNAAKARELQEFFGFNDEAKRLLLEYCNGPTAKGAPFLASFSTKVGEFTQLLYSTISPVQAWALTTTAEDVNVRRLVCAEIGGREGRRLLARYAPSGSVAVEVEHLKQTAGLSGGPRYSAEEALAVRLLSEYREERIRRTGKKVDE